MAALSGWTNFYVIVGSAAGVLIGLQFVVMTLIANMPLTRVDADARQRLYDADRRAFRCRAVAVSGYVRSLERDRHGRCTLGLGGPRWGSVRRPRGNALRSQTTYQTVFEDRLFHVLLPLVTYALLAVSAHARRSPIRRTVPCGHRSTTPALH